MKRIIAESENLSAKLIAAETRSSPTQLGETIAMAQTALSHDAANRVLFILPANIVAELFDSVPNGGDVIICADGPPRLEPNDRVVGRFEYGSLINLPRASSTFDAAVCVSRELEPDIAPFALREIFRVIKAGGQLVFAPVGQSTGLDLRQLLSAARIGFDEDEMPSLPVYSFSLRRNGQQAVGTPARARSPGTPQGRSNDVDPRLALIEEENTRQINLVRDTFAERQKVIDEEHAVVDGAIQHGFGGDGWIWVSKSLADGYPGKFFLKGWRSPLEWAIFSRDNKCLLMLPYPEEQSSRAHSIELQLHLTLPDTSASNPMTIGVRVNDGPIENFHLSTDDEILNVLFSTNSAKFRGVSLVEFHPGVQIGDGESKGRRSSLAMGVRRFRYRLLSR